MRRMPMPMSWLRAGVPLTLLVDLLDEQGPRSGRIYAEEEPDLSWLRDTPGAGRVASRT